MKPILIGLAAVMLMVAAIAAGAQNERDIERQLRAAMDTEVLDRNPRAAIEQYKKVAGSGIPRLEAQALLRMADCYRQLGDSEEVQRIYEQHRPQLRQPSGGRRDCATAIEKRGIWSTASGHRPQGADMATRRGCRHFARRSTPSLGKGS